MNRKGQLAIFIIIGIILLFSIASYLYLKGNIGDIRFKKRVEMPIVQYVDECVDKIAWEGIKIMGLRGGYIELPDYIKYDPFATLPGIDLVTGKITAMWYYNGLNQEPMDEEFPTVMEQEINDYVNKNLHKCLDNFAPYQKEFNITTEGDIVTDTILGRDDVTVEVNYNVIAVNLKNNEKTKLDKFVAVVPVRLRQSWELARDVLDSNNRLPFIEKKVIDLIALDDDGSFERAPHSGIALSCAPKLWVVPMVKQRVQKLVQRNLPFIRVLGTDSAPYMDYDEDDCAQLPETVDPDSRAAILSLVANPPDIDPNKLCYYKSHYQWKIASEEPHPGMNVDISYSQNWPMDMTITPGNGAFLKSGTQQGSQYLSWLCIQLWKFRYSMVFPIKVVVSDNAPGYRPFQMTYGMEVSINGMQPDRTAFGTGIRRTRQWQTNDEFCRNSTHRKSISVKTYNAETRKPLKDIRLTFTCGKFECSLGETDWSRRSNVIGAGGAVIETEVPYCVSAILTAEDPRCDIDPEDPEASMLNPDCQYKPKKVMFSSSRRNAEDRMADIYLEPIKRIPDYKVFKTYSTGVFGKRLLSGKESVFISITNLNNSYSTYGIYSNDVEGSQFAIPLEFMGDRDETYKIEMYLMRKTGGDPDNLKEDDTVGLIGGYSGNWTVKWSELKNAKSLDFFVVEKFPPAQTDEETFDFLINMGEHSKIVDEVISNPQIKYS